MNPRIFGIETEFGSERKHNPGKHQSPARVNYVAGKVLSELRGGFFDKDMYHQWTVNGGRAYQDTGNHLEFATPEVLTPEDATIYLRAQYVLAKRLSEEANTKLAKDDKFTLMVDNVARGFPIQNSVRRMGQPNYSTWSQHESFSFRINRYTKDRRKIHIALYPFLATRLVSWCGNGQVYIDNDGKLRYLISQRAEMMMLPISESTTDNRGVVNTRHEDHTPNYGLDRRNRQMRKHGRLHNISSDTLQSESMIWLRAAVTGMMLDLIEKGEIPILLWNMKRSRRSILSANRDLTMKSKVWYFDSRWMSTLDVQRYYWKCAERHYGKIHGEKEAHEILEEWDRVLDALEKSPRSIAREVEWLAKRTMLETYIQKKFGRENLIEIVGERDQKRAVRIDMLWHALNEKSLFELAETIGAVERLTTEGEVEQAIQCAPVNTRANIRSQIIKFGNEQWGPKTNSINISWLTMKIATRRNNFSYSPEPFVSELPSDLLRTIHTIDPKWKV